MNEKDVERSSQLVVGLITVAIFVSILLLVVVIVYNALGGAYDSYNGVTYTSVSVANETGAWLNSSGYTLDAVTSTTSGYTLTAIYNTTDDVVIALANATVSASGVVTNASVEWTGVYLSYTYLNDTTSITSINTAYDGIQTNILSMATNFFSLAPTIGTLLAVIILITVIVILVMYVSKMRNQGGVSSETFSG